MNELMNELMNEQRISIDELFCWLGSHKWSFWMIVRDCITGDYKYKKCLNCNTIRYRLH